MWVVHSKVLLLVLLVAAIFQACQSAQQVSKKGSVREDGDGQQVERPEGEGKSEPVKAEDNQKRQNYSAEENGKTNDKTQRWRYKYFYENRPGGNQVQVHEGSIDQRLANVAYTMTATRFGDTDGFKVKHYTATLEEELKKVAGNQVDDQRCSQQLAQIVDLLDEFNQRLKSARSRNRTDLYDGAKKTIVQEQYIRFARFLDSYGRYESGHLGGKTMSFGSYGQCVGTKLLLSEGLVDTRFCWARLGLDKHLDKRLGSRQADENEADEKHLLTAICLPVSCHMTSFAGDTATASQNKLLAKRLIDSQFKLPSNIYLDESFPLESIYCAPDSDSQEMVVPLSGKLFVVFALVWLAATIYATRRNNNLSSSASGDKPVEGKHSAVLDCLDLRRSWRDFVCADSEPRSGRVDLDAINPVKAIICSYVVLAHALILQLASTQNGLRAYDQIEWDLVTALMTVGSNFIDVFFVITGMFLAYITMRRSASSKQVDGTHRKEAPDTSKLVVFLSAWLQIVLTRYLRLFPLLFLFFWFKKSLFVTTFAGGPTWDHGQSPNTEIGACRQESWLTPILMQFAYLPLSAQCLAQAWTVSSDMFCVLVATPILLVATKKPKLALMLAVLLCSYSIKATLTLLNGVEWHQLVELLDLRPHGFGSLFRTLSYLYSTPATRLGTFCIGLFTGYLLSKLDSEEANASRLVRLFNRYKFFLTMMSVALFVLPFLLAAQVGFVRETFHPHHRIIFPQLLTGGRILWSFASAILIVRVATDFRYSSLTPTSSRKFWRSLAKLNYAILLAHVDYFFYLSGNQHSGNVFTRINLYLAFAGTYMFCIPVAIFLHVVFENPVDKLIKKHLMPLLFK